MRLPSNTNVVFFLGLREVPGACLGCFGEGWVGDVFGTELDGLRQFVGAQLPYSQHINH